MLARALLAAALLGLAGCELDEPTLGGTVVRVLEAEPGAEPKDPVKTYEDPLLPQVWRVEVCLDDGAAVTVTHSGLRRYSPGERVRLLVDEDGSLLL